MISGLTTFDCAALQPFHGNPRRGDVDAIARSLEVNGQYRPIVVNIGTKTGRPLEVLAGNHTLAGAVRLGWSSIDATTVDVDDDAAARIVLVDNRTNDLATVEDAALAYLLSSLPDLDGTGFDQAAFDALLATVLEPVALNDPDDAPGLPAEPVSVPGDVWLLGKHRVVCGDATDIGAYDAILGGARPDCVWTDPPYGVEYVGKTKDALTIENDGAGSPPRSTRSPSRRRRARRSTWRTRRVPCL